MNPVMKSWVWSIVVFLAVILWALFLYGCTVPPMRKTEMATFPRDDRVCAEVADVTMSSETIKWPWKVSALYRQCMEARGYTVATP